ncbi:enoyl-CoA hydratase/isomerase family protein [Arthrobacter sp. 2MCAF14]|uniref:enoyl-CoA hydratase/isomerase family protein n=1 Tax=Arthrobacter sp. 2MCAF14 TaxID=3232982 RepID=UPI003F937AAF
MTAPSPAGLDTMTLDDSGSVATLTIGTGQRFNALGQQEWETLERAATSLAEHEALKAVVVRGRGGVFCSGSDLREWEGTSPDTVSASFAGMEAALQAIEDLPVPTVAAVEGFATGAGCQLALACDLQLMNHSAKIGMPIARLGLLVPATFANRMSLRIGPSRTKDLLYGGRLLTAQEANDIGLITTVVADDDVDAALGELLARWESLSAASLRASKAAVDLGLSPVAQPARHAPQGPASDPQEFAWRVNSFLHRHLKGKPRPS